MEGPECYDAIGEESIIALGQALHKLITPEWREGRYCE